jgi:hypothetical protein
VRRVRPSEGVMRVRDDLVVEVKRDRLVVQRGQPEEGVFPGEARRLMNTLRHRGGSPGSRASSVRIVHTGRWFS